MKLAGIIKFIPNAAAIILVLCMASCSKDDRSGAEKAHIEDIIEDIRADFRQSPGFTIPTVEIASRNEDWGYEATFCLLKGQKDFARMHLEGEFIHTSDGIIYGVAADRIRIDIEDKLILEGSNQNIVEYAGVLASLCTIKDVTKLEQVIALANSMGSLMVYYPDREDPAGTVELISIQRKGHYAPAFAIRVAGSKTYLELNTPLNRIFRLSSDIVNLLP